MSDAYKHNILAKPTFWGSGCDSVGRVVTSDTRGPWFESRNWQFYFLSTVDTVNNIEKTKIKRPEMTQF